MSNPFSADFNPQQPFGVDQYANEMYHFSIRTSSSMSKTDEKTLEMMAKNVKASYAYHVKKACEGLEKQLEERNREIDDLHKKQEVGKSCQADQVPVTATESVQAKELKEKDNVIAQLRARLEVVEHKLSDKLTQKKAENDHLHDRLQAVDQKLYETVTENVNLQEQHRWMLAKKEDELISTKNQLRAKEYDCQELKNTIISYKDIFRRYNQDLEWEREQSGMRAAELDEANDKLRVLKIKCQEYDETEALYKDAFESYHLNLDWEREKNKKKDDKLEDAKGMLEEFQKWKDEITARLPREVQELAKFTNSELAEQIVLLHEIHKKDREELDSERGEMKMLKDLMKFEASKLEKTIKEKTTLESRLDRWTREAKRDEERKLKNQRAAATQTEPASMGQWDRRDGVFANSRTPCLGQEKAEKDQKSGRNERW